MARFMGPTWGPSGADKNQVGPMLGPMNFAIWDVFETIQHGQAGTKPLPEPMLTYHQSGLVTFIWWHYHEKIISQIRLKIAFLKSHPDHSGDNELMFSVWLKNYTVGSITHACPSCNINSDLSKLLPPKHINAITYPCPNSRYNMSIKDAPEGLTHRDVTMNALKAWMLRKESFVPDRKPVQQQIKSVLSKMDAVSQTTLSNAFSWTKMLEFRLKFHWSLFLRVQLTIIQHWFR